MKAKEFISEFVAEQFPSETGAWVGFDDHDPVFSMGVLCAMERQGVIEVDIN